MRKKRSLTGTITVRLPARSLRILRERARKRGLTTSEALRELVEREVAPEDASVSAWDLSQAWVGAISSRRVPPGARARESLADWVPDRR
jgi:hypothetical protein